MGRLQGKIAIITGAGAGIARAATLMFAREGAKVIAAEIDQARGQAVVDAVHAAGGDATFCYTDVTDEASVKSMVAQAVNRYGNPNVVFNCAGGSLAQDKPVTDVDIGVWQHTMDLDLKGPFLVCRHSIPRMIEAGGGVVINVASAAALKGSFPAHVYSAAKGGVVSFTRALAGSYSHKGVRSNVICPGVILSERVKQRFGANANQEGAISRDPMKRYPFGQGEPDDIAHIALFLASDESRMVNGAVIPAEGGLSAY